MKKLFSLILTAAMLLTLTACGTKNAGETPADNSETPSAAESIAPTAADEAPSPTPEETPGEEPEHTGGNILIAYFSCTGTTKAAAEQIAELTGGTLYEIVPEEPYTSEDLDYHADNCRAEREINDPDARPAISGSVDSMEDYDVVFIGYPIWWGQAPKIIDTFLESYDFSGKTIVPFCTSASSGIDGSISGIQALAPDADWLNGQRFSGSASLDDVKTWIDGLTI